jgi:folate-binding protein YgfZ
MNAKWKKFLLSQQANIAADGDIAFPGAAHDAAQSIYALAHLTVLTVAGKDAAKFLQGQCTCDINAVSTSQGGMGAFCNAKGRVVATFLIVKKDAAFLLVLPAVLADSVKNRLQRYILRSDVAIADSDYCPLGLGGTISAMTGYPLPQQVFAATQAGGDMLLHFPVTPPRYVLLATDDAARMHWTTLRKHGFKASDTVLWRNLDRDAGIPWLDLMSSEQFIPQMLNLDRLGGIGFGKGCYTGQEVVARTQYLGTVKRRMYLAECPETACLAADMDIVDLAAGEEPVRVGKLLSAHCAGEKSHMLVVLQTAYANSKNLRLQNANQDRINVRPLSYVTDSAQPEA